MASGHPFPRGSSAYHPKSFPQFITTTSFAGMAFHQIVMGNYVMHNMLFAMQLGRISWFSFSGGMLRMSFKPKRLFNQHEIKLTKPATISGCGFNLVRMLSPTVNFLPKISASSSSWNFLSPQHLSPPRFFLNPAALHIINRHLFIVKQTIVLRNPDQIIEVYSLDIQKCERDVVHVDDLSSFSNHENNSQSDNNEIPNWNNDSLSSFLG